MLFDGYRAAHYKTPITACRDCPLRAQRLRNPDTSQQRQLTGIEHREGPSKSKSHAKGATAERMRRKFDTPAGRAIYGRRMVTVEPACQPSEQQDASIHAQGPRKGERAVATVHDGAQYREDCSPKGVVLSAV
jgi:hypothetical protein